MFLVKYRIVWVCCTHTILYFTKNISPHQTLLCAGWFCFINGKIISRVRFDDIQKNTTASQHIKTDISEVLVPVENQWMEVLNVKGTIVSFNVYSILVNTTLVALCFDHLPLPLSLYIYIYIYMGVDKDVCGRTKCSWFYQRYQPKPSYLRHLVYHFFNPKDIYQN